MYWQVGQHASQSSQLENGKSPPCFSDRCDGIPIRVTKPTSLSLEESEKSRPTTTLQQESMKVVWSSTMLYRDDCII